jgi:hypothetical protein
MAKLIARRINDFGSLFLHHLASFTHMSHALTP